MNKYTNVGTEGHPDHGKQLPQVLIVGEESENFSAVYEELLKLEAQGEVEIVYQDVSTEVSGKTCEIIFEDDISGYYSNVLNDSLSMLTYNTTTDKIHKHPHWHKGRW